MDAFAGFFILVINFTLVTGVLYGAQYMKVYKDQSSNLSMHWICYLLTHASLISVCVIQNSLVFLIVWEVMALASFFLVIFEHYKHITLKAGINYLIQSHVVVLFLTIAFIWVYFRQGSYDFKAIRAFAASEPIFDSLALLVCFFVGFGFNAEPHKETHQKGQTIKYRLTGSKGTNCFKVIRSLTKIHPDKGYGQKQHNHM